MKLKQLMIILLILFDFNTVYAIDESNIDLPTFYDLRNDISIKVENQENRNWCDTYSELKMIETYIQKTTGLNYDLSEGYSANWSTFGGTYGKQVLESDFPTKEYELTEANQKKFDEATSKSIVESFEYLSSIAGNKEKIKEYILNYGGVFSVTMCDNQMDNYRGGIYRNSQNGTNRGLHGLAIIGWDDNYSKDNFYYEKPENDGAWLVLNSWGTKWGNNGTAWVSYEDSYSLNTGCYGIKSLTLSTGETIETYLESNKQEQTEIEETPVVGQKTENLIEQYNKLKKNRDIFIITYIIIMPVFIIIGIKILKRKHKNT